jgi:hypothetical protein
MENVVEKAILQNIELMSNFNKCQVSINKDTIRRLDMNDETITELIDIIGIQSKTINDLMRKVDEHERRLNRDSVGLN